VVELKGRNSCLQEHNDELVSRFEYLREDVAKSNQEMAALMMQAKVDYERTHVENEQHKRQMEETTKKLANLRTDYHQLSEILEAKTNIGLSST
jgi:site-specific DNA-adenine methylase